MKFIFVYPAKIIFAERNVQMTPVSYGGLDFFVGPINKNIWFCTKTEKVKVTDYRQTGQNVFHVYLEIEGCLVYCACIEFERVDEWFERNIEFVKQNFEKFRNYVLHPEIYEQEQAENRAKFKAERELRDAEQAKLNADRLAASEALYMQSIEDFKSGKKISWDHFERAIKENNINLPIKTLGFGRKWFIDIGTSGATTRGTCHNSPVIWRAVKNLKEVLNKTCAA